MNFGYLGVFWRTFFGYTGILLPPPLADPEECRFCFKHYSRHYNELAYHRMEGNKCLGHQPIKDAQQFSLQQKRI